MIFAALLFVAQPPVPCVRPVKYITITLSIPQGLDPRDVVRLVDNNPYEGVDVVDAKDLPGKPKRAKRPSFLPKLPRGAE